MIVTIILSSGFLNSGNAATNKPPIINSISATPNPAVSGDTVNLKAQVSDENPNSLSYNWQQGPGGPRVQLQGANTASASFTAPKVAGPGNTQLIFTLTVTDQSGLKDHSRLLYVGVAPGHPPIINSITATPNPAVSGDTVNLKAQVSDENPNSLSYNWQQGPGGPRVQLQGANTASPSFTAPQVTKVTTLVFGLTITDETSLSAFKERKIGVSPSHPPVINSITATPNPALSGSTVNLKAQVSDENPNSLSYNWQQGPGGPRVQLQGSNVASPSFTAPQVPGSVDLLFGLTVTDNTGLKSFGLVRIGILPTNNPPVINSITATPNPAVSGNTVNLKAQVSDEFPISLSYSWVQTSGPNININGGNTASPSFTAPQVTTPVTIALKLTITDNQGQKDSKTFDVTVNPPPNNPPQAQGQSITTSSDTPKQITLGATDPDSGDTLTFSIVNDPQHGTLSPVDSQGKTTYTPANGFSGSDSFTFKATDNHGSDSNVATVSITVEQVIQNNPPQAQGQSITTPSDTPKQITLGATDPDSGDTLTFSIVNNPQHGTLSPVDSQGKTTYTPANGFSGSDSFTFKATDNHGSDSNVATVSITVEQVIQNNPPQAQDFSKIIHRFSDVIALEGSDPDPLDTITYSIVTPAQHLTLGQVNEFGEVPYTKNDVEYIGPDSFTYKVTDNNGAESNIATVSVTILGE